MKIRATTTTALAACALIVLAGSAHAADFDATMETILVEYLTIQDALAADTTEGVEGAAHAIQESAKKLHPGHAAGEHADHYMDIPKDLLAACETLHDAEDISSMREAFKELSKPVSTWVTMAKRDHMSVMYCPMKEASWVQRGSKVANPYLGEKMGSCGQKVGGGDH
jgi:hypothetical protein